MHSDIYYNSISLYKFVRIKKIFNYKNILSKTLKRYNIKGVILIAPEGINMNISVVSFETKGLLAELYDLLNFSKNEVKIIKCYQHIYRKLKIKIKKEIISTENKVRFLEKNKVGEYIKPAEWDSFIQNDDVILVDTRNEYEINVGTFKSALNPKCKNFSAILNWISSNLLKRKNIKRKKIVMFCTGGIRCEKATSFVKELGHKNVYHLQGGILNYFNSNNRHDSWTGECFVFDDRVSIKKDLSQGEYEVCYACRMPLSKKDTESYKYEKGISCTYCYGRKTKKQLTKYSLRQKQINYEKK